MCSSLYFFTQNIPDIIKSQPEATSMLFGCKFSSLIIRLQLKICVIISVPVLVTFFVVKIGTLIQQEFFRVTDLCPKRQKEGRCPHQTFPGVSSLREGSGIDEGARWKLLC